jgi:hypothetical protein
MEVRMMQDDENVFDAVAVEAFAMSERVRKERGMSVSEWLSHLQTKRAAIVEELEELGIAARYFDGVPTYVLAYVASGTETYMEEKGLSKEEFIAEVEADARRV